MPTTDFAEKAAAHLPVCADIAFTIISGRTSYASRTACRCPDHSDDALRAVQRWIIGRELKR